MSKEILVCLDGSHYSEQMLPPVVREASLHGSRVTLFHVLVRDLPLFVMPSPNPVRFLPYEILTYELEERRVLVSSRLERIRSRLIGQGIEASVVIADGRLSGIAQAIVDYSSDHDCSLVIMAAHGYRGLHGWLRGSVTQSVIRESAVPVLVIRMQPARESSPALISKVRDPGPSAN
jgi:nucleotide-binding universal stress UspA family protein